MHDDRSEVTLGPVFVTGVTTRQGGHSAAPYDAFNLATHVGDDPAAVAANRRDLQRDVEAPIVWMDQVHGDRVAVVTEPRGAAVAATDALVTSSPGLVLAVLVADCVPVMLVDETAEVVGVAHAGRRGLVAGIVPRTLDVMATLGSNPANVHVRLGPAICGRCYEVAAELRDEVEAAVPGSASTTGSGMPGIDIKAGLRTQLLGVGDIHDDVVCTVESTEHYSYRRDGVTGRFAGFVKINP
ncbi:MAG: purine-nucleoside/S-methyl-5-thioadenosine phosphorylase / adenosine deaminase [Frankiales bacterium]|jgi:YfiH family protein|nr:purine-nucleoside/S-methyl-5-thioadenosine phosphorylase / adenosine deaminase [Frankiales bacterium]